MLDKRPARFYTVATVNVAIVGPTYPYRGGIAHYTTLLAQQIAAAGHHTTLFSYIRQYPRWLFPGKSDRDPSAVPLRVPAAYTLDPIDPRTWWRTVQQIRQQTPDVIVLQWWVPFWAPSLIALARLLRRRTNAKIVFICHNVVPHEGDTRARRSIAHAVLRHADTIVVHSAQDMRIVEQILPGAHVRRTAHPTYGAFEQIQAVPEPTAARKQLGLNGKQILLFFGLVRPYKGLSVLLNALPQVREQIPNVHLLVAGEVWGAKEAYTEQIHRLDLTEHVTLLNRYVPNEEVGVYFAAANVVVLPYVSATQSGVVQMAFGFGVPVISTRVGGLHEAVAHQRTGLLVPPRDPHALAAAIVRFFRTDLGPGMRAAIAAQQREGRFAWSALVDLIERAGSV